MSEIAWLLTLVCLAALSFVFIFVIKNSTEKEEYSPIQTAAYSLRKKCFYLLIIFGVIITVVTLVPFPISAQNNNNKGAQVVHVKGFQWYWTIDKTVLNADQPVEFQVTTADVNHGFGIYDEAMKMVAQTQAMPGYTNKLLHTFSKLGKYKILCLEYCGVAHHTMLSEFEVVANVNPKQGEE